MIISQVVTKTGDSGTTTLGSGQRVSKCDERITALGAIDEANAHVGFALQVVPPDIKDDLLAIQKDLFDLGADLCYQKQVITSNYVKKLEDLIIGWNANLKPLPSFVLPGGGEASARLHISRTVVRRAERQVVAIHDKTAVNPFVLQYLNRLSDLLFVLSRYLNTTDETLWKQPA